MRHSDAIRVSPDGDFFRDLSSTGLQKLEILSNCLENKNFKVDVVYCSPALRTKQTWEALQSNLDLDCDIFYPEDLYSMDLASIAAFIENIDTDYKSALIIGHNPTISYIGNHLLENCDNLLSFKPANIACIKFDSNDWQKLGKGKLEWLS